MTSTGGGGGKGQVEPFLRSRPPKNSWLPSDALRLCSTPPPLLTEAEKQEQEAVAGGGPTGSQGGSSTRQGHSLWKTVTLMSPPIPHQLPCPQPVQGSAPQSCSR